MVVTTSQTQLQLYDTISKVKDKESNANHAIKELDEVASSFGNLNFASDTVISNESLPHYGEPSTSLGQTNVSGLDTFRRGQETCKSIVEHQSLTSMLPPPHNSVNSFVDIREKMDELVIDPKNQYRCPGKTKIDDRHVSYNIKTTTESSATKPASISRSGFDNQQDQDTINSDIRHYDPFDVSAEELAAYFEEWLHLPKKMSLAAEMMYT